MKIKNRFKTGAIALAFIMSAVFAYTQTVEVFNDYGKQDDARWKNTAKQVFFENPHNGRWLTVIRFDCASNKDKGFDPSFTYAVSKFKPVVKKYRDGMYQITFECEICQNLP